MGRDLSLSLQKQVIEYFEKYDDKTFIQIVDTFVYSIPVGKNVEIGKIINDFLKLNGLESAFLNYVSDQRGDNKFFVRSSMSEIGMIDNIKSAFLNASFNRFRNTTLMPDVKKELDDLKQLVIKFMSPKDHDEFDEAIDILRMMDWTRRPELDED